MTRFGCCAAFLLVLSCGGDDPDDPPPSEDAEVAETEDADDAEEETQKQITQGSYYSLLMSVPGGVQQKYERNIDERPDVISFGSSHIGTAVSLAINDVVSSPKFASIVFNFGFVVGSNDYPVTIDGDGRWDWPIGGQNAPPAFKFEGKLDGKVQRNYVSWLDGASGHYDIERWGTQTGELVKGTLEGTLVAESSAEGEPPTAYVVGEFQFFLPNKGQ